MIFDRSLKPVNFSFFLTDYEEEEEEIYTVQEKGTLISGQNNVSCQYRDSKDEIPTKLYIGFKNHHFLEGGLSVVTYPSTLHTIWREISKSRF